MATHTNDERAFPIILSVIIPTWNTADLLDRMLDSIVLAEYTALVEIIIVDDGSTDHTSDIVKKHATARPIVHLALEHRGVNPARNSGMQRASGEFVTFVDSDDVVSETWLIRILQELLAQSRPDVISMGTRVSFINGDQEVNMPRGGPSMKDFFPIFTAGSIVYRTSLVREVGGYDESLRASTHQDLWRRISKRYSDAALHCVAIPEALYHYRRRQGSVSTDLVALVDASSYQVEQLRSGHLQLDVAAQAKIYGRHAVNLRRTGRFAAAFLYSWRSFRTHATMRGFLRLLTCAVGPMSNLLERTGVRRLPG